MWRLSLLAGLFGCLSSPALSVDRTKFRTCDQTSFCRRHRNDHSERLYDFRLVEDSIHFHIPSEETLTDAEDDKVDSSMAGSGLWKSLQRNLGLDGLSSNNANGEDIYVRGPEPTLTGTLVNTAAETSTGSSEDLQWSLFALSDGMLRMRITEKYGSSGTAYEQPRVTYDELVLTPDTLHPAEHARLIRSDQNAEVLQNLVPAGSKIENYVALQWGDQEEEPGMILLVQLDPFAVSLYREDSIEAGPVVSMGDQERFHFELRRSKDSQQQKPEEVKEKVDDSEKTKVEEAKEEKEIVGYWEDGLAIYADGTREEKKEEGEEANHRKLAEAEADELDRTDMWEEKFSSHHDSKPFGPMSVGLDVSFPDSKHLFGLPEHASSTVLKNTRGKDAHYKDPYRLYNLDVFEYELDETMALYGHVPLVVSQSIKTGTAGVFWFNPTETFVDVFDLELDEKKGKTTHWMSESGIVDIFLLAGPDPHSLYRQYSKITGTVSLPPMFSLGYHQCRWNYKDEKDVYDVHAHFEEYDYPYDVLWLDIEHTDGKRYFTWDKGLFPNPIEMQEKLASQGRRMVTIIDPHIKRDNKYYIHKEATAKGLYIKKSNGKDDYDGWCWPGSSSYLDFTSDQVRSWWADQFAYNRYQGSTPTLFTWNDMNEPSVFNGPEVSMQKDLKNLRGEEHREWHNLYGMLFHRATTEGQVRRNQPDEDVRPFVLSRAFFAGSQRYGAIWTGDNKSEWSHLEVSSPMLLSLNVAALSFVGADVGGFFGNPDGELFARWMQAGAYQPFFRGHAHHDSKRREPWMFGEQTLIQSRKAAMERYALLPFWYTVFHEASVSGMPVMRTMWMQYPETEELYSVDNQYLIGSDMLVKPVTAAGVTETEILFPVGDVWYDAKSLTRVTANVVVSGLEVISAACPIDNGIPVFQRGGSIIPRKLRLRRSALLMKNDPYTIYIALNTGLQASGLLYMDDEETFGHLKRSEFAEASFSADFSQKEVATIKSSVKVGGGWESHGSALAPDRMIERIIVMGVDATPKSIDVAGSTVEFQYDTNTKILVLRKPMVSAMMDWSISITF